MVEVLAQVSPTKPARGLRQSREAAALAEARTCYDHLAGRAGVALLDALLESGVLTSQDADGMSAAGGPGCRRIGRTLCRDRGGRDHAGRFGVDVAACCAPAVSSPGPAWTGRNGGRT